MIIKPSSVSFESPKGFIVLDGVNGAGKSTLLNRLSEYLQSRGHRVVSTFEPGATALGKSLRKILLERGPENFSPEAEMFLFAADRREHRAKVIEPSLAQGKLVISDRYYYSTTAFQGYGRKLDLDVVSSVNKLAVQNTLPDLVILLDLDPVEGLKRTGKRASENKDSGKDAFEAEEISFHERLRNGFIEQAKTLPEKFLIINAAQGPDAVFAEAKLAIDKLIEKLPGKQCDRHQEL